MHVIVLDVPLSFSEIVRELTKVWWRYTQVSADEFVGYEPFFDEYGNQWDMGYVLKVRDGQVEISFEDNDIPEFIDPEDEFWLDIIYDALVYSVLHYLGVDEREAECTT